MNETPGGRCEVSCVASFNLHKSKLMTFIMNQPIRSQSSLLSYALNNNCAMKLRMIWFILHQIKTAFQSFWCYADSWQNEWHLCYHHSGPGSHVDITSLLCFMGERVVKFSLRLLSLTGPNERHEEPQDRSQARLLVAGLTTPAGMQSVVALASCLHKKGI